MNPELKAHLLDLANNLQSRLSALSPQPTQEEINEIKLLAHGLAQAIENEDTGGGPMEG